MHVERTEKDAVVVKFATTTKVTLRNGQWTKVRGLTAMAVHPEHGYTIQRFESLDALGAWLDAQGFEWIAESQGEWRRSLSPQPLAA